MFSIGEFAKVKSGLIGGGIYGGTYFNRLMQKYIGGIILIENVINYAGGAKYEFSGWHFTDEMLEPIEDLSEHQSQARLLTDLYNIGKTGDVVNVIALGGGLICLDKEYLPMLGVLSANEAEKI